MTTPHHPSVLAAASRPKQPHHRTKPFLWTRLAAIPCLAALTFIAGCGGGAGENSTTLASGSSTSTATSSAEGWWTGSFSSGQSLSLLVTSAGQYFGVYGSGGANGLITGSGSVSGSTFTSSNGKDFGLGEGAAVPFTLSATAVSKVSLNGSITEGSVAPTFTTSYNTAYGTAADTSKLAASYTVTGGSLVGQVSYTMQRGSVANQYTLTPTNTADPCRLVATLTPHASNGYYDLAMVAQSGCTSQYSATGVALPNTSTLVLAAVLSDQSSALFAVATPASQ